MFNWDLCQRHSIMYLWVEAGSMSPSITSSSAASVLAGVCGIGGIPEGLSLIKICHHY